MNNYDKILNYTKENNGYITAKEVEGLEINSTFLSNLVIYKKLERVNILTLTLSFYTDIK